MGEHTCHSLHSVSISGLQCNLSRIPNFTDFLFFIWKFITYTVLQNIKFLHESIISVANINYCNNVFFYDIKQNSLSVYGKLFYFIEEILSNNTKMTQSYRTVTKTREMNTDYDNSLPHQDRTHYSSQNHGLTR